jgi:hypothetical protein
LISRAFDCPNSTVSLLTATIPSRPPKDKPAGGQVIEPQQPKNDLVMLVSKSHVLGLVCSHTATVEVPER